MIKYLLLAVLTIFFFTACGPKTSSDTSTSTIDSTTQIADTIHTSQNSVDWAGIYKGVVPCADCEGIETLLVLNPDNTYLLRTTYLGKPEASANEKTGSLSWNAEGNTVSLNGIENAPNQYFVGENNITQLDMTGNKIEGNLADKYVLVKQ